MEALDFPPNFSRRCAVLPQEQKSKHEYGPSIADPIHYTRIPQSGWSASPQGSEAGAPAAGATRRTTSSSQLRALDFDVPETISFEGVETLVMVSAGTEEDDVVISRHNNAITAAERDEVGHFVYTSLTDAGDHLGFALAHRWTERRLRH